ncbi:serine hydrolase domain-containing protein [Maricaulis sp. CAU 1757]
MKRIIAGGLAAVVAIGLVAVNLSPIGRIYLPSGTGIVAKQVCSLGWVSRLDPDYAKSIYLDPLLGGAAPLISLDINEDAREVSAAVLGLFWRQRAVYRDGLGCTLLHGEFPFDRNLALPPAREFQPLELDTEHRERHFDTAELHAAITQAFDGPENNRRNTLAVAVLHEGRLVTEAYARGASRETRFHGWSMTKSAMATLAGVLEQDGVIDIEAPGQVPALTAVDADYADVTIEHLLRMSGGFAIAELNNGSDPNSQMLFTQADMPRFAATRERLHGPGEHWEYMSGNTILATHAMQQELGETLPEQVTGLRERLFEPLGIYSAILEVDESGTFQGSSYMYATAHDWARLAQLYLDDGMAGGERMLPDHWDELVSTPTEGSNGAYGMGFWLPPRRDGLPEGTFFMNGFQMQSAYILPEADMVIVRFGATNGVSDGMTAVVNAILDARLE